MNLVYKLRLLLLDKDSSRNKILSNIVASLFIKGGSILVSIITLPLTINYIDKIQYGVWITLSSVLNWLYFFDIGLGNGLKNKYVEAITNNDYALAKKLVSTTYALVSLIAFTLCSFFLVFHNFINYSKLFNTPGSFEKELRLLFPILFIFFNLQLILNLITPILTADHKISRASFLNFVGSLLGLIAIFILSKTVAGSLLILGLTLSGTPLIVLGFANYLLFKSKYKFVSPSWSVVDFSYSKKLLQLGTSFFVIQIAVLIIFSSTNFLIAHLLGPLEVAKYNIAFKYFSVALLIFNIILGPYWTIFTEAYIKKQLDWLKSSINQLIKIWMVLVFGLIIMLVVSPYIYKVWIGESIQVEFNLSVSICIFVIISTWNSIYSYFLNALGKIRLQLYLSALISIINIPLAILFVKYFHFGVAGVILATSLCLFISSIVSPIQYKKIITNKAVGIWNK